MARQRIAGAATWVEHVSTYVTDPDSRLAVVQGEPATTTTSTPTAASPTGVGPIGGSIGDKLGCAVYGMASVSVLFAGSGSAFAFEASLNGGASYDAPVEMRNISPLLTVSTTASFGVGAWEGGLPAGATHFQVRATSAVSPTVVTIAASAAPYHAGVSATIAAGSTVTLLGTGNRIGQVGAASFQNDETSTPLAGSGTFVGANRDLTGVVSGVAGAAAATFEEFRGFAESDVAGTLFLAVSVDNVTYRRVKSVVAAASPVVFVADFEYRPKARYARVEYDNGAGAQGYFALASARMAD